MSLRSSGDMSLHAQTRRPKATCASVLRPWHFEVSAQSLRPEVVAAVAAEVTYQVLRCRTVVKTVPLPSL